MIPSPFGRRRAERFAQLLDEAEGAPRHHTRSRYDEELGELVAVARTGAQQLSTVADEVTVDSAYRRRLRQRLLAVAQTQGMGETTELAADPEPAVAPRRRFKLAVAVGAASGVLALSGVSTASADAVPGDPLYGMKRQTERAQLALAGSNLNKGQLYFGFAKTRLREARAVAGDTKALSGALDDMDSDVREGVRLLNTAAVRRQEPALLAAVERFVTEQRRQVVDLVTTLKGKPRLRALKSLDLLHAANERASGLRQALMCTDEVAGYTDSLGPQPRRCSAVPAPGEDGATEEKGTRSRDGRTSDSPSRSSRPPGDRSSDGLLPDPTGSGKPDAPTKSPGSGILNEIGKLIDDLLGR